MTHLSQESVPNIQKNGVFGMASKTNTSWSVYKKDDTVHCWQGWRVKRKERNIPLFWQTPGIPQFKSQASFQNKPNTGRKWERLDNLGGLMQVPLLELGPLNHSKLKPWQYSFTVHTLDPHPLLARYWSELSLLSWLHSPWHLYFFATCEGFTVSLGYSNCFLSFVMSDFLMDQLDEISKWLSL